jgi:Putative peptidoglycan binding domain/CHAP domain
MPLPQFPGRLIKKGDRGQSVVKSVQRRLKARGCGPLRLDGDFDKATENAVKLFQARFSDVDGTPLVVDGQVGSITWAALFGEETVPSAFTASSALLEGALTVARSQIGVMEQPPGSNRGPEVDEYVRRVGLNPSGRFAWCVAFLYFCFDEAAIALNRPNPVVKTAGVLDHWSKAGARGIPRITGAKAVQNPELVQPGQIFVIDTGAPGGFGHAGFVLEVAGGKLVTIEGNTNTTGSPEGIGVFKREARKIAQINKGFIDYGAA